MQEKHLPVIEIILLSRKNNNLWYQNLPLARLKYNKDNGIFQN